MELGELVRVTARPLEELAAAMDVLVTARAVTEREQGRVLDYDLHTTRSCGRHRRRPAARAAPGVAAALRGAGRTGEAARHFARSSDVGDRDVIAALREAVGQAEAREAYREALELLGELVELLPPGDPGWLEVFDALSWGAEWVVDHRADHHARMGITAMRALDALLAGSADLRRAAAVRFRLGSFLAWGALELDAAEVAFRRAVELFEQAGDQRQALLAAREVAWTRGLRGDLPAMEADATRPEATLLRMSTQRSRGLDLASGLLDDELDVLRDPRPVLLLPRRAQRGGVGTAPELMRAGQDDIPPRPIVRAVNDR